MNRLPDGSGFFVATIGGPRKPGIVPFLKYTRDNCCRSWLLLWRNYCSAYTMSRNIDVCGPPLSRWRCIKWAFLVTPLW